jgi:hypothetical protein
VYSVANIIVIVGNNRDSTLRGCFGWGGRKLYVAGKYMAELTVRRKQIGQLFA